MYYARYIKPGPGIAPLIHRECYFACDAAALALRSSAADVSVCCSLSGVGRLAIPFQAADQKQCVPIVKPRLCFARSAIHAACHCSLQSTTSTRSSTKRGSRFGTLSVCSASAVSVIACHLDHRFVVVLSALARGSSGGWLRVGLAPWLHRLRLVRLRLFDDACVSPKCPLCAILVF